MPVYKEKSGNKWYVQLRYVDWTGKRCQKMKRGFATKKPVPSARAFSLPWRG